MTKLSGGSPSSFCWLDTIDLSNCAVWRVSRHRMVPWDRFHSLLRVGTQHALRQAPPCRVYHPGHPSFRKGDPPP
eukprot:scaffold656_cov403-Pavlova_lutheri.AAC.30